MTSIPKPFGLLLAALALARCVDVTPLLYEPPARDGGLADAGRTLCNECIYRYASPGGPGCQDKVDKCNASAGCASLLACITLKSCFAEPDQNALTLCAFPCAVEAGITGYGDPNLDLIYRLQDCTATCPSCPGAAP
jgi:hypothetical protein